MATPVHIVSVNQDPGIGPNRKKGAAVHLKAMRDAFRQLGTEVTAVDEPDPPRLRDVLQRIARQREINLVYERYALGCSTAARFAREHGIPYALEVNAPLAEEEERWRGRAASERERAEDATTFGVAGFVAAVSSQVAAYAVSRGAAAGHVFICPNGVDSRKFRASPAAARPLSPQVPDNAFVLGFHGRERPWHGFARLVAATDRLLKSGRSAHLLVIGEGDFAGLSGLPRANWTRLPWVEHEEIPALISRFDVLPLTYSNDAPCYFSPLKLAEAMACGVVPVVPDLGDLPRLVEHRRSGLVYEAGNLDALCAALLSLIIDPTLKADLSAAATEAVRDYGWNRTARRILDHFGLSQGCVAEAVQ